MVQATSLSNQFATLTKVGQTGDNRVLYRVEDSQTGTVKTLSVAQNDAGKFETSYNSIVKTVPKLQNMNTPESVEKRKKLGKIVLGVPITLGILIPMIKTKGSTLKQVLSTIGGAIGGAAVGIMGNVMFVTPKEVTTFSKATQVLSKIDVKEV